MNTLAVDHVPLAEQVSMKAAKASRFG